MKCQFITIYLLFYSHIYKSLLFLKVKLFSVQNYYIDLCTTKEQYIYFILADKKQRKSYMYN